MQRRAFLLRIAALGALAAPSARARAPFVSYPRRDEVRAYIDALAARGELKRGWIERVFAQGRYLAEVERLMQPPIPFGSRNWREYRDRYLEERRIRDGVAFLIAHEASLERAEARYGVPREIVTAILGVETRYGRMTGTFRTLDVLLTLSFDYLRRADFFRGELEQFLLLAREQRLDPLAVRGSFAGAIGIPQFMPSSVRKWAVDFDGDGHIDLARSAADSIGSVANFLVGHGWQADAPILLSATLGEDAGETTLDALVEELGGGIRADTPWSMLAGLGVHVDAALPLDAPVLLIDLPIVEADGAQRRDYRLGTASFASILHYNRSYFYATAVVELASALREHAPG
jgi:membrane-bound lytic murein transglycosylase B